MMLGKTLWSALKKETWFDQRKKRRSWVEQKIKRRVISIRPI